jgi:hypothetical protein
MHHYLTPAPICHTKLMVQQMKKEHISELKTQDFINQLIKDHAQKFDTAQKFGESQKPNGTKDVSNGP